MKNSLLSVFLTRIYSILLFWHYKIMTSRGWKRSTKRCDGRCLWGTAGHFLNCGFYGNFLSLMRDRMALSGGWKIIRKNWVCMAIEGKFRARLPPWKVEKNWKSGLMQKWRPVGTCVVKVCRQAFVSVISRAGWICGRRMGSWKRRLPVWHRRFCTLPGNSGVGLPVRRRTWRGYLPACRRLWRTPNR